jgi:hypothetical protein
MQREITDMQRSQIGTAEKIPDFVYPRAAEDIFQENIGIQKVHQTPRHSNALCWSSTEEYRLPSSASVPSAAHLNTAAGDFLDRFTSWSIYRIASSRKSGGSIRIFSSTEPVDEDMIIQHFIVFYA